jgi:hypothetical protein
MELETTPRSKSGNIRLIAVAYFVGTIFSVWVLSAIGVPMPTTPGDASRDQTVIVSLAGAFALALALFHLARGLGGSALQRLLTLFTFTYVAFAVTNQLQAAVFTTIGGADLMMFFYAIPCLLAAGAAVWLVRPVAGTFTPLKAVSDRPLGTWWWRPILVLVALPCLEGLAGLLIQPLIEPIIHEQSSGLSIPSNGVVVGTMLLKSAFLLTVVVPIVLSWTRSRLHLAAALGTACFVLTGLVGLIQATWWPVTMRVVLSFQILVTSAMYAAVTVALLVPKSPHCANVEP